MSSQAPAVPALTAAVRTQTVSVLSFGLLTGYAAALTTTITETVLGGILITGVGLRLGLLIMAGWLAGIMSPIVLFFADMFPDGAPTLAAQYVLKAVILAAAGMVVAGKALGARFVGPADPA
ncbi:hypothetical protein [Microlunatus sp. Y2014]|uniref:hypothetical protein n=1 Tax=Microlunatus sp. Y2014 TaxID=3418488 RepID=UPI003DA74CA2